MGATPIFAISLLFLCGDFTITLGYADCISRFIEVEERTTNHGTRTRFLRRFKNDAYSSPEMRNIQNFWIVNARMNHWAGFTVDLDNSVLIDTYSKLSYSLIQGTCDTF